MGSVRTMALVGALTIWALPLPVWAASASEHYRAEGQLNAGGNRATSQQYQATGTINFGPSNIFGSPTAASPAAESGAATTGATSAAGEEGTATTDSTASPTTDTSGGNQTGVQRLATGLAAAAGSVAQTLAGFGTVLATAVTETSTNEALAVVTGLGTLGLGLVPAAAGFGSAVPVAQPLAYAMNGLFGWTKRRRGYGRVYDAGTRKPIAGATVRLLAEGGAKFAAGKLVATATTDPEGRYRFQAEPGRYRLEVVAPEYTFPSKSAILDYHGEHLDAGPSRPLNPDVPLDGRTVAASTRRVAIARLGRMIQWLRLPLMVLGTASGTYFVATRGTTVDFLVLSGYLLIWGLELTSWLRLHQEAKVVAAGQPVDAAVVRLFDQERSLLGTVVSQPTGRFAIFAPSGRYLIHVTKSGYALTERLITLRVPSQIVGTVRLNEVGAGAV